MGERNDEGIVRVHVGVLTTESIQEKIFLNLVKCEIHVCQFKDCKSRYETF